MANISCVHNTNCLSGYLSDAARHAPDCCALVDETSELSFRAQGAWPAGLPSRWSPQVWNPAHGFALLAQKTNRAVATSIAILRAGSICVPWTPGARLSRMLRATAPCGFVVGPGLSDLADAARFGLEPENTVARLDLGAPAEEASAKMYSMPPRGHRPMTWPISSSLRAPPAISRACL